MPHAHKLVLCVDIENTLKILMPHAHNLVMCVDIENTLKILTKYSCPTPKTLYCVWILKKIPLKYSQPPQPCTVCRY